MIVSGLAWMLALAVAMPLTIYIVEVAVGLPADPARSLAPTVAARTVVLIPAHDEAAGLAATLAALRAVIPADVRVLVVADNCGDRTAAIARAHGAETIERSDPEARGKGHALAFGRDHLASARHPAVLPEVVVVLDADCRLTAGSIGALTAACRHNPGRPAQAINLISPDLHAPPLTQIAGFAMVVKNLFRARGMQRMGGTTLLTGTGMAFSWPLFAKAGLASGSLVEDLELGISMTRMGYMPLLVDGARVSSAPAPPSVALIQRTRWEHGFLETGMRSALPLLYGGIRRSSRAEILLALHLLVPPLALLLLLAGSALVLLCALIVAGAGTAPAALVAAALTVTLGLTLLAWLRGGRPWLRARALAHAPLYILWKMPVYLGFLRRREMVWHRTPRSED